MHYDKENDKLFMAQNERTILFCKSPGSRKELQRVIVYRYSFPHWVYACLLFKKLWIVALRFCYVSQKELRVEESMIKIIEASHKLVLELIAVYDQK